MPNWCANELTIRGDQIKILEFVEANQGLPARYKLSDFEESLYPDYVWPTEKHFCFNALVPVPAEVTEIGFDGHNVLKAGDTSLDGYNWQIKYWGTKWDIYNESVMPYYYDGYCTLEFETAWAPPLDWLEQVAPMFPELQINMKYREPGMAFAGEVEYLDGELSYEEYLSGASYFERFEEEAGEDYYEWE